MTDAPTFERLLKRDRTITVAGLAMLCVLSWLYIATGAGLGMNVRDMASFALFPHLQNSAMPGMDMSATEWSITAWALMIAMWWTMMIAMMTPSAVPTILLYARVHRHAVTQGQIPDRRAPTGAFAAGYLSVWLGFALAAALLHWMLERAGIVSATMMGSQNRWLSGGVLIAAGLYQISPLKNACLSHCRAPGAFLARHWRPNAAGALWLGAMHGVYCIGCCWMLMALLFVGGAMNLVWIAALTILVLIEKFLPAGKWAGRVACIALIGWGVANLLVPGGA